MGNVDWNDPLSLMLQAEEADDECDALHSLWDAHSHCAKTFEVERGDDMLGASPFELSNYERSHHEQDCQ